MARRARASSPVARCGACAPGSLPAVMRPRRTLIVGAGTTGRLVERKLAAHPEYGLELVGFVDDDRARRRDVLGTTAELHARSSTSSTSTGSCSRRRTASASREHCSSCVRAVRRPDVHLSIVPTLLRAVRVQRDDRGHRGRAGREPAADAALAQPSARSSARSTSSSPRPALARARARPGRRRRSRSSSTRAGPVFFRQARQRPRRASLPDREVPHDGRRRRGPARRRWPRHEMEGGGPLFKIHDDPRDHAGRRVPAQVEHRRAAAAVERAARRDEPRRPAARSSSTSPSRSPAGPAAGSRPRPASPGLWQVLGRNDIPFEEMVKLDYVYVTNWSLWWDIKILFQTHPGGPRAPGGVLMPIFVVPAFNEEANVPRLLADLEARPELWARRPGRRSSTTARPTAPSTLARDLRRAAAGRGARPPGPQPGPGPGVRPRLPPRARRSATATTT